MKTTKQEVLQAISNLPENVSIEEIFYTLHVIFKIKMGQKDIKNGLYISSDDLKKEISKW